jgi:hypothetical protein
MIRMEWRVTNVGRNDLMRGRIAMAGLSVALFAFMPAHRAAAQEGNDISRLTCAQFVELRQSDREQLLVWLAGYYAGGAQRPIINGRLLTESAGAIDALCRTNPATPMIGSQMRALITGMPPAGSQGAQGNVVVPNQPQAAPVPPATAPATPTVPTRPQPQP